MAAQAIPLKPIATAVWLIENTGLTFDQIADFCGMHLMEVQATANEEANIGIKGENPITVTNQLTAEEIKRCQNDPRARLKLIKNDLPQSATRTKGPRYTPISKRGERPDAVAWLIKTHPELQDSQIARLVGTTKDTIEKVRNRTHWNASNIKPQNPVLIGICKQADLDAALVRAHRRLKREQVGMGDAQPDVQMDPFAVPFGDVTSTNNLGEQDQPDIDPDMMIRSMG